MREMWGWRERETWIRREGLGNSKTERKVVEENEMDSEFWRNESDGLQCVWDSECCLHFLVP